jgi:hypothetical protein
MVPSIDGPEEPYYFGIGVIVTKGMRVQAGMAAMALVINEADQTKNIPVTIPLVTGKATEAGLEDAIKDQVFKMVKRIKEKQEQIREQKEASSDKQTPEVKTKKKHPLVGLRTRKKRNRKKA